MKSIVPVFALTVLAALALTGCGPNSSSDSANTPATNSSVADSNGMSGVNTNVPATNNLPEVNTNLPTGTNQ
jgi:ABC-type oligopeptide transport system substrate-binding subunit